MNFEAQTDRGMATTQSVTFSKRTNFSLFAELVKIRLTSLVVITAVGAYLIMGGLSVSFLSVALLALGGFLVTGASNVLNQVLEKDFDVYMKRTMNRPIVTGEVSVSSGVLLSGLMCLGGVTLLALFNVWAAFLGMLAFVLYSFLYTPLKRFTPVAVLIGGIAGAMPMMIGAVAYEGGLSYGALLLFGVQFCWQFPHFWAIAFLGNEDYNKAGFEFIPQDEEMNSPSRSIATSSLIYSILLLPIVYGLYALSMVSVGFMLSLIILTMAYIYYSYRFWKDFNMASAKKLMFMSLLYIPLFLFILIAAKMFV